MVTKVSKQRRKHKIRGSSTPELEWLSVSTLRGKCREHGYYWDRDEANRIVRFFHTQVRHVEGELGGQLVKLERWQKHFLRRTFGWLHIVPRPEGMHGPLPRNGSWEKGPRVVRELWIEIPRKNGKSFLCSGLALYLFLADREGGSRVICAAADKEQATQVYRVSYNNVLMNPHMLSKIGQPYAQSMSVVKTASSFAVVSGAPKTKHGLNLHGGIIDEVHVHPSRDLIDTIVTSTSARRQPLIVYATTAGELGDSIGWELHEYGVGILDREFEDHTFYPIIYGAEPDDDFMDPEVWFKANPNLGISKKLDYMRKEALKASRSSSKENSFKRLELNIWTEQAIRWIPMKRWDKCDEPIPYDRLAQLPCFIGLDISSTTDMTSMALVFVEAVMEYDKHKNLITSRKYFVLPQYWLPAGRLAEDDDRTDTKTRRMYQAWRDAGFLRVTDGEVVDQKFVRSEILAAVDRYDVRMVGMDPWNATQLATDLRDDDGIEVVMVRQGFGSLSAPSKELEALVLSGKLIHGKNPILRWNARNAAAKQDAAGNIKPDKSKSKGKIDGLVATIMGLGISASTIAWTEPSIRNTGDLGNG